MPATESEMVALIKSRPSQVRREGETIPQGLSVTLTPIAEYWRYREGDSIRSLRRCDGDTQFLVDHP